MADRFELNPFEIKAEIAKIFQKLDGVKISKIMKYTTEFLMRKAIRVLL